MENRNHVIYPGRNNYYCYRSSSKQRDLRVVKGFPFSRELTGFSLSLSLSSIIARLFSNSFRSVSQRSQWQSVKKRFVLQRESFISESGERRTANERARKLENLAEKSGRLPPVPLSLLVLSADEPREFNRRTSLQEKKTIFPVHLQRCTRSCLQWFPPTRRVSPVEGNGLVSDHVV